MMTGLQLATITCIVVMLSSAKHLAQPLRLRSGQAWPGWAGVRSFVSLRVTNARVRMTFMRAIAHYFF